MDKYVKNFESFTNENMKYHNIDFIPKELIKKLSGEQEIFLSLFPNSDNPPVYKSHVMVGRHPVITFTKTNNSGLEVIFTSYDNKLVVEVPKAKIEKEYFNRGGSELTFFIKY